MSEHFLAKPFVRSWNTSILWPFDPVIIRLEALALLLYLMISNCYASGLNSLSLAHDVLESSPFTDSGIAKSPESTSLSLLGLQTESRHIYEEKRGGVTSFKAKNLAYSNQLGAALAMDLGDGLGLVLEHSQIQIDDKNTRIDRVSQTLTESYRVSSSSLNLQVELSESLRAAFLLRFLDSEISLLGNYFVSNSDRTTFKPSLFGSGGGLQFSHQNIALSMSYVLPMKGKTEIYSEEKVIAEPGFAKAKLGFVLPKGHFGASVRRWIYKQDDRVFGTTLDDANQSEVDLFGLNRDKSLIFLLEQKQVSGDYLLGSGMKVRGGISLVSADVNYDSTQFLPGENESGEKFDFYFIQLGAKMSRGKLDFTLGGSTTVKREFSINRGGRDIGYRGAAQTLFALVRAEL